MIIRETAWNTLGIICKLARVRTDNLRRMVGCWILMGCREDYQERVKGLTKPDSCSFLL